MYAVRLHDRLIVVRMITCLAGVEFNCVAACNASFCLNAHFTFAPRDWKAESTFTGLKGI